MQERVRSLAYYLKEAAERSSPQFLSRYGSPVLFSWESLDATVEVDLELGKLPFVHVEDQNVTSAAESKYQVSDISVIEVRKYPDKTGSERIQLGRGANNDIILVDRTISKLHAYFQKAKVGDSYELTDAGSTNGTKVNEQPLVPYEAQPLNNRDRIALGPSIQLMYLTPQGFYVFLEQLGSSGLQESGQAKAADLKKYKFIHDKKPSIKGKREGQRVSVKWPVRLRLASGTIKSVTKDISTVGVYVYGAQAKRLGETFTMTLEPPNHPPIIVIVESVWGGQMTRLGMGVRFVEISDEDLLFISEVVRKHRRTKGV